ncbi:MAG: trypsin-like peptidase domain-containing protein [Gammaproteobacteria bacterium]|nr:trypsin-like peptidase domain-containing protein [Gammaproteobacteria bacterium]
MKQHRFVNTFKFLLQAAVVGLASAFVILWLFPGMAGGFRSAEPATAAPVPARGGDVFSYHTAVNLVAPAVVNVYAIKAREPSTHPLFQDPLFKRLFPDVDPSGPLDWEFGSGVILDAQGLVITNAHIIDGAVELRVTLKDGRQTTAQRVGSDPATELAVLRLHESDDLPVAPIGDSDQLRVGDVVLAIGNPYDFGQTVTQGIVSATGRNSLGITTFEDFIQTDADINPGNSGGALINAAGQVIGINTANYSETGGGGSQGIGFAIPINLATNVMRQLIEHGQVARGWLGIEARVVPRDTTESAGAQPEGVLVAVVLRGGPAANAGIRPGDILTEINGTALSDPRQTIELIAGFKPGSVIGIKLVRGWDQLRVQAQVGQRPAFLR